MNSKMMLYLTVHMTQLARSLSRSARASSAKCHRPVAGSYMNLLSHSSGGRKLQIKMSAGSVPSEHCEEETCSLNLFQLLLVGWQSLAFPSLQKLFSNLCLYFHKACPLCQPLLTTCNCHQLRKKNVCLTDEFFERDMEACIEIGGFMFYLLLQLLLTHLYPRAYTLGLNVSRVLL